MGYTVIGPEDVEWRTRPTEPSEAERHMAPLSDLAGFEHTRANLWRYDRAQRGGDTATRSRRRRSSSSAAC